MSIAAVIFSLIILLPGAIFISLFIIRRNGTSWMVLALGVLSFLVGQIVAYGFLNYISGATFFQTLAASPVLSIIVQALIIALVQLAVLYAGYLVAFRTVRGQSRSAASALTMSAGFSSLDALVTGIPLLGTLLSIIQLSQLTAPPEGMTAQQFADQQTQLHQFLNLPLIDTFVLVAFLPTIAIFIIHFAAAMITWVGVIAKKWHWLAAGVLWLAAMLAVHNFASQWSVLYTDNHELYGANLVSGTAILVLLIFINLGVIYVIYRRVNPLLGDDTKIVSTPAPAAAQPARDVPKALDKPGHERVPSKKLKNTDLK